MIHTFEEAHAICVAARDEAYRYLTREADKLTLAGADHLDRATKSERDLEAQQLRARAYRSLASIVFKTHMGSGGGFL